MPKKKDIEFSILEFGIEKFSSSTPKETIRKDRIGFQIQHIFNVDAGKKLFQVRFRIHAQSGRQNPIELALIETFTTYKLKGVENDEMFNLPDHLVTTFLSIAYSNTRGALTAKAQGTIVGDVPLPLINPTQVIEEMKKRAESGK